MRESDTRLQGGKLRRVQFFEILDQPWCPHAVRDGATDALEAMANSADIYRPVRERFLSALRSSGAARVVDLCSGGGGPWLTEAWLNEVRSGETQSSEVGSMGSLPVVLTDKFPSEALAARVQGREDACSAIGSPVDATRVPQELCGFRTVFSSFHHFPDSLAAKVLGDAVRRGEGFASAEVTARSAGALATMFLLPFFVWILTPRMRPFSWARLLLTYLVPVIPFVILWDGVVSCLRTRTPAELLALTSPFPEYEWTAGSARGRGVWLPVVYLIGLPRPGSTEGHCRDAGPAP